MPDERYALADIRNVSSLNTPLYLTKDYVVMSPDTGVVEEVLSRLDRWGYTELLADEQLDVTSLTDQEDEDAGFCIDTDNPDEALLCDAFTAFFGLLDYTEDLFGKIRLGKDIDRAELTQEVQDTMRMMADARAELLRYSEFDYPVDETAVRHAVETMLLTLAIAPVLGLDEARSTELGIAALLHNVGWLRSDRSLQGSAEGIQAHSIAGFRYLREQGLPDSVARVALEHHEHADGSGQPRGVGASKLGAYSKVVALTSSFSSSLSARRFVDDPAEHDKLYELYNPECVLFNKAIRKAMFSVLNRYPIGNVVLLSSGQVGTVIKPNPDYPRQPVVRLMYDGEGNRLSTRKDAHTSPEGVQVLRHLRTREILDLALGKHPELAG